MSEFSYPTAFLPLNVSATQPRSIQAMAADNLNLLNYCTTPIGVDDTAGIAAAIIAASITGKPIYVPGGLVFISTLQTLLGGTIFFTDPGNPATIKLKNGESGDLFQGTGIAICEFHNIILDGNYANTTGTGVYGNGVHILGGSRVVIDQCRLVNWNAQAARLIGVDTCRVTNNVIDGTHQNGIYWSAHTGTLAKCLKHVVSNNVMLDTGIDGYCFDFGCETFTVTGNIGVNCGTLAGGGGGGLILFGDTTYGPCRYFTVTGNAFESCYAEGISWHGIEHCLIANNVIANCGLTVDPAATRFGHGIAGMSYNTVPNSVDVVIVSNVIFNVGKHGIYIAAGSAVTFSDVLIANNIVYNPSQLTANTYDGINVKDAPYPIISSNKCIDTAGTHMRYGIVVDTNCTEGKVRKNGVRGYMTARYNVGAGIVLEGVNTAEFDQYKPGTTTLDWRLRNDNVVGSMFVDSGAFYVGTANNTPVEILQNNGIAWTIDTSKNFLAGTDAAQDLGTVAKRPRDARLSRDIYTGNAAFMHRTTTALNNGAAVAAGTLLNAPAAGNPTKWLPIDDNGTTRYVPAW